MNYIAIIGDIRESKKLCERNETQEKLKRILDNINKNFESDISAKFVITLGDEFQGLLRNYNYVFNIIKYIQKEMYPVNIRFGVGVGKISTDIISEAAIGADGPAYYAARNMIDELREQEKKLKNKAADIQVAFYNRECFEITEINTLLSLIRLIEEEWTEKQRFTIWDMEQFGGNQEECARRMDVTQSTVARRLYDGNYITYERAKKTIAEAFKRIGEIKDND